MWITRPAITALLVAATGSAAFAHPIEIATLGRAPLMGESTTPGQLKSNIQAHPALLHQAADKLGLSREEWNQFELAMSVGKPNWVTVPRHLDAMTWASGGQVHVLHDVVIPANQKGIEVDLHDGGKIVSIFVPAKCGNISVIRRTAPHIAAVKRPAPRVAAARIAPVPLPAPVIAAPAAAPVVAAVAPAPVVPVVPVVAASHGVSLLPLLGALPFLFHGGGGGIVSSVTGNGGGGGTIVSPPPCPPGVDP